MTFAPYEALQGFNVVIPLRTTLLQGDAQGLELLYTWDGKMINRGVYVTYLIIRDFIIIISTSRSSSSSSRSSSSSISSISSSSSSSSRSSSSSISSSSSRSSSSIVCVNIIIAYDLLSLWWLLSLL